MVITMKKTIATLMSLTAACAMFTPGFRCRDGVPHAGFLSLLL